VFKVSNGAPEEEWNQEDEEECGLLRNIWHASLFCHSTYNIGDGNIV